MTPIVATDLQVPDRFEGLRDVGTGTLKAFIDPVEDALSLLDQRFEEIQAAKRGALLLLRGSSGSGKSTFLNTVGLFRKNVFTDRIAADVDVGEALRALRAAHEPRVVVLEGREAMGEVSESALESAMHSINTFVRSETGRLSLVVWPTNTDDLARRLASLGQSLGGEALFGTGEAITRFMGPQRAQFVAIAQRTVSALNEGASFASLGISEERAIALADDAATVGKYLALVRSELLRNEARVRRLQKLEQVRLWILVVAGNDTEGDVAALTRGGYAAVDTDRLMTATRANIVADLKKRPDDVGILATMLDAKIINLDMLTALAIARTFADATLISLMRAANMSTRTDKNTLDRLRGSELGLVLSGQSLGTLRRGTKPGSSTISAFANLAGIAREHDGALNRAIGAAIVDAVLAESFETERDLEGEDLRYTSDLYVVRDQVPIRIEVMWRSKTGRADIANYTLTKLGNYARTIGLLK